MSDTAVAASSIDEGVDRKALTTLKKRFLQVNSERLDRARLGLGPRSRQFLDLLPLLFHCNHPMLPGYVSHLSPCGVVGYSPSKHEISQAQRLARSFVYRRQPGLGCDIQALFLMGSCGTVGQTDHSDLDVWVCHLPEMEPAALQQLRDKADAIAAWAKRQLNLDVHCFLMADGQFLRGERTAISAEDCGTSQHYLLLDEFYRTGLLLAGRIPIWWLVPPTEEEQYDHYAETLRRKRYIRPAETLDFGSIAHIPAGEFIGAGIWQLYKAIDSPYKSVLKLLLTEVYASEYPHIEPLSHLYKRAVYRAQLNIDELDPYVMVYRKLEKYLTSRGELERLELVRRCFYFKVGKALTRRPSSPHKSWQRLLLERLVRQWGWSMDQLRELDGRAHWKAARVMAEQNMLVQELNRSYRYLQDFAQRSQAVALISSQDMTLLGRKLYAAFERKAGKVEWVNPGIAPDLTEELLTFARLGRGWCVFTDPGLGRDLDSIQRSTPLKREQDLLALMVWCVLNGLIGDTTRLQLSNDHHGISDVELNQILRALRWLHPEPDTDETASDRYAHANRPQQVQLFINIGINPMAPWHERGVERLSSHTDSLGYSGMRDNLVLSIDWLQRNSWGDVVTRSFRGSDALLDCIRDYLMLLPSGLLQAPPTLDIRCFSPSRSSAIAARVEELFHDLAACFHRGAQPSASRYVLEIERTFHLIQYTGETPTIEQAQDVAALFDLLARPQAAASPLTLDRHCLPGSVLAAISAQARPGMLSVFYQRHDYHADLFVMDEHGALYRTRTAFYDERSLLWPLDRFLRAMLFRRAGENAGAALPETIIHHYELIASTSGIHAQRRFPIQSAAGSEFHVQAIASGHANGQRVYDIYCGGTAFTELEWGADLYRAVARHILQQRRSADRYPCYITDLDLSRDRGSHQTLLYLRCKQQLEGELNRALAEI